MSRSVVKALSRVSHIGRLDAAFSPDPLSGQPRWPCTASAIKTSPASDLLLVPEANRTLTGVSIADSSQ